MMTSNQSVTRGQALVTAGAIGSLGLTDQLRADAKTIQFNCRTHSQRFMST